MMPGLAQEQCIPCKQGTPPAAEAEIQQLWLETPMWEIVEDGGMKKLRRTFEMDAYREVLAFVNRVGQLAEAANHHPLMIVRYKDLTVEWWTHAVKGLHRNDFIMASRTDEAYLDQLDFSRTKGVVNEASDESFPASDPPGWIGKTQEEEKVNTEMR